MTRMHKPLPALRNGDLRRISKIFYIIILLLLQFNVPVSSTYVTSPFYPKTNFTLPTLDNTTTLVDVVFNSTHLFVLDNRFRLYFFSVAPAGEVVLVNNYDVAGFVGDDVCCDHWLTWRPQKVAVLNYNPYNDCLYLTKYTPSGNLRLEIFQFQVPYTGVIRYSGYDWGWWGVSYYQVAYGNPRVSVYIDDRDIYLAQYNEPTETSPQRGFFIGRMSHTFVHFAHVFRTDEQAVYIEFKCRGGNLICVWTASRIVFVYEAVYLTLVETQTVNTAVNTFNFEPGFARSSIDGSLFFGQRDLNQLDKFVIQKYSSSYNYLSSVYIPITYAFDYNATNYHMSISQTDNVYMAVTTNSTVTGGLGGTEVLVAGYDSDLVYKSRLLISTATQDNLTRIFVPSGDEIMLIGTTDGNMSRPIDTLPAREMFVLRYAYIGIINVATAKPNSVIPGEIIQIEFNSLPVGATSSIPSVLFNNKPCTNRAWNAQKLSAKIPAGVGGLFFS
ncbi:hypothetical protein BKA69DRAFT_1082304 [Paraphysoderma sedebokerense]|nr:hypothetical protein BKA69DRAFT_1082304 [Paraphysoderma sedebokerense]